MSFLFINLHFLSSGAPLPVPGCFGCFWLLLVTYSKAFFTYSKAFFMYSNGFRALLVLNNCRVCNPGLPYRSWRLEAAFSHLIGLLELFWGRWAVLAAWGCAFSSWNGFRALFALNNGRVCNPGLPCRSWPLGAEFSNWNGLLELFFLPRCVLDYVFSVNCRTRHSLDN